MKKLFLMLLMCAPMAVFAQKFGHVNAQEIIQVMPEYLKAKTEIDALQQQYEADLKGMQDEVTKKVKDYEDSSVASKSLPRCSRRYSRAIKTTSRLWQRHHRKRCKPLPLR